MSAVSHFTAAGPPPPPPVPAPGTVDPHRAPAPGRPPGWVRRRLADTPGRLSALSLLTIIVLLAFGIVGGLGVSTLGSELNSALRHADQLVLLQDIRTGLVQADAAATNAYLAGGLEDRGQRQRYVDSIDAVSRDLIVASDRSTLDDADELAEVNQALATYTGLVESARANNRQRFPVGASYLRQASDLLRTDVQPKLAAVGDAEADRVLDDFDRAAGARNLLLVALAVALVTLIAGQLWLARRVRRYVNVPLGGATSALMVVGVLALVTMAWATSHADQVRQRSLAATLALARARVVAFDAKSDESLRLILQGSGAGDTRWKALDAEVVDQLDAAEAAGAPRLHDTLAAWRTVHEGIRALDDGNDWKGAVNRATATGEGSSNQAFATFAAESQAALDAAKVETKRDLPGAADAMAGLAIIVLLIGAAAAYAARQGYGQRLREYR